MLIHILVSYILISYIIGLVVFVADCILALPGMAFHAFWFRIGLLAFSPLTAWHAVLHYGQALYCKLTNKPLKFWI